MSVRIKQDMFAKIRSHRQIRFVFFGCVVAISEIIIFKIFILANANATVASATSFLIALCVSFIFNKQLVFKSKEFRSSHRTQVLSFCILSGLNIIINAVMMYAFHAVLGVDSIIVKLSIMLYIAGQNYYIYSRVIFRSN